MKVLISACLLGDNCKYNGGNNYNENVKKFIIDNNACVTKFCPESLAGLKTPRNPVEYKDGKLIDAYGNTYEEELNISKCKIMALLNNNSFDLAITKAKSPSCGCGKIYDGSFSHTLVDGDGFAVEMLKENNIKVITENDL